jgi:hypothetical protein
MALSDLRGSRPKAAQFRPRRRVRLSPWAAHSEVRVANRAAKVIDPKSVVYSTQAPSADNVISQDSFIGDSHLVQREV